MDHRPRGRAVVISNHFFLKANLEVRDGAEFDEVNIRNLFTQLYFDVKLYTNKSANVCCTYLQIVLMNLNILKRVVSSDVWSFCTSVSLMLKN